MPNQTIYILNYSHEHCPIGVPGEIYIGGIGVAMGYWQDNLKTNISFIQHNKLGRLYNTGDIGKWNKLGYVEFLGRKDKQIKLNGYRIELEEIASKLTQLSGIEQAVTKIQTEGTQNYIVAYLSIQNYSKYAKEEKYNNQDRFKLEQKGILNNLKESYKFNFIINEQEYKLSKYMISFT